MADFRGRQAVAHLGEQSNFTTAATVYRQFSYYGMRMTPGVGGFLEDERLGLVEHNPFDAQAPAAALPTPSLEVDVPADMAQSAWFLEALFGKATPSGSGPYVRDYPTGAGTLPILTVVQQRASASDFRRALGWRPNGFSYEGRRQGGYGRFRISGPCRDIEAPTSVSLGTVPTALTPVLAVNRSGSFAWDSVNTVLTSFSVNYQRAMDLNEDLSDSDLPPGFDPGASSLTGRIEARYASRALYDDAVAAHTQTPVPLQFVLTASANHSLTLTVPRARLVPAEQPVEAAGRIIQSYDWRAEVGAAAAMGTFQLSNSQATYAWS